MELKLAFNKVYLGILACINRTFMELKRVTLTCVKRVANGINRTFMELKLRAAYGTNIRQPY